MIYVTSVKAKIKNIFKYSLSFQNLYPSTLVSTNSQLVLVYCILVCISYSSKKGVDMCVCIYIIHLYAYV